MQQLLGISIAFIVAIYLVGAAAVAVGGDAGALAFLGTLLPPVLGVPVLIAAHLCPDEVRRERQRGLPVRRRARLVAAVTPADDAVQPSGTSDDEIGLFVERDHG